MKRLNDSSDVPEARLGILPKTYTSSKRKTKLHSTFPREEWVLPAASTKELEVVDSGASMHMVSETDLNSAELETMRTSRSPTTVMTANGEVQTREEATVYVNPWPFWLKRFACVNVVSRPTGLAMVSAARRAASRAGYAWRRKQPGISSAVELLLAAGRFLQLESGWTTTELLALLAGGSFETTGATQQSCCTGGSERGSQIDAREEAIIELERVQALLECRFALENISSCAKRTVSELNACMAVFGGSLVDEPFVSDLPRVVLPFLDDDIEPPAVTRDEPAPVIEFLTPTVQEYVSLRSPIQRLLM